MNSSHVTAEPMVAVSPAGAVIEEPAAGMTVTLTLPSKYPPGLTEEEYLDLLNRERTIYYIPAMVFVASLMFLGIIGNSLVLYVYSRRFKKTSSNYFILTMAVFDLISCMVGMPTEIYDLNNHYTFYSTVGCKIFRGCETFTVYGSAIILVEIAFDRYFKICRPLMIVRLSKIKMLCGLAVILAMIFSIFPAIMFGPSRTNTSIPNVRGHDCSVSEEYKKTTFATVYFVGLAAIFTLVLITLTALYIRIWLEIRSRKRFMIRDHLAREDETDAQHMRIRYLPSVSEDDSLTNSVAAAFRHSPPPDVKSYATSLHILNPDQTSTRGMNTRGVGNSRAPARLEKRQSSSSMNERRPKLASLASYASRLKVTRTTVALFAVTVAFMLSYLPSIAIMVVRTVDNHFETTQSVGSIVAAKIFSNFFFINNAINPIIYSFLNINFRCQVQKTVKSIFCCCLRRDKFQSVRTYTNHSRKRDFIIQD